MTDRMVIANILYYAGILGFAVYVLISYITSNKVAAYIFARDLEVKGKIVPCHFAWLRNIPGFVFLAIVVIGFTIGQEKYTILIFTAVAFLILGTVMFIDACKYLTFNDEHISITVFQKNKQYLRSDIRTVEWRNCRGITGKQLAIMFHDGKSYYFNMDYYRGVQNTYNELTNQKF